MEGIRRRNTDTRAATAGKILAKQRRWARELREAGWGVVEPKVTVCPSDCHPDDNPDCTNHNHVLCNDCKLENEIESE